MLDILQGGSRVVVDPGVFTNSLTDLSGISAVVITHVHNDHLSPEIIKQTLEQNPEAKIFGPQQVASELSAQIITPETGKKYPVGDFSLEFFGQKHHLFDDTENIAVCLNDRFFIPGDSYTKPGNSVEVAAVPVSAPWLRIDEAIDNIKSIDAKTVLPTHNALLSDIGESIHYRILGGAAEESGKIWKVLKTNESIEV